MSTSNNRSTDEAEIRDLVESWARAVRTKNDGTALMRCGGTEVSGDKVELDFRLTICFRKIGGRWTVMHEHHSIPAS